MDQYFMLRMVNSKGKVVSDWLLPGKDVELQVLELRLSIQHFLLPTLSSLKDYKATYKHTFLPKYRLFLGCNQTQIFSKSSLD